MLAYSTTPPPAWSVYLGAPSSSDYFGGVATDSAGNIFVTGNTLSNALENATNSFHGGSTEAYVMKLTPAGKILWSTYLGGSGEEESLSIAIDSQGNAVIAGTTTSTDFANAGNTYLGGSQDLFAAKIDTNGSVQWARYIGGSGEEPRYAGIAVGANDDLFLIGSTKSTDLTLATNSPHADFDCFVTRLSSSGQPKWSTYLGGSSADYGYAIAVDTSGNTFVTGRTLSNDFDAAPANFSGPFVSKFDAAGKLLWTRAVGVTNGDSGYDIKLDPTGDVIVTGSYLSFNLQATLSLFVRKFTTDGQASWLTLLGGSDDEYDPRIVFNASGNTVIGAELSPNDPIGTGPRTVALFELDNAGQTKRSDYMPVTATGLIFDGIALDAQSNPLIFGRAIIDLPGAINTRQGYGNSFIMKSPALGATGTITGKVFTDTNANGIDDPSELPVNGATVYLDYNNNNKLDYGEIPTQTVTDSAGQYVYKNLADGSHYRVRQVLANGFRKTLPTNGVPGYDITISGGNTFAGKDFGVTKNVLLAGTIFNDTNKNGVKDDGELPIANVTLNIISNGQIIATRTTGADGKWRVQGLGAGSGSAEIVIPDGYAPTAPVDGKYTGSMTSGQMNQHLDFGLLQISAIPVFSATNIVILLESKNHSLDFFDDAIG